MRRYSLAIPIALGIAIGLLMPSIQPIGAGPPVAAAAKVEDGKKQMRIPGGKFEPRKKLSVKTISANAEVQGWGLGATGIKVADAWKVTKGKNIKIGVLDQGVDDTHPEFGGRTIVRKDFTGSPAGTKFTGDHGTHCAAIIAMMENGVGYVGVAPEATIYSGIVLGFGGSGDFDWLRQGIEWCIAEKVDVISMSLGGNDSSSPDVFYPQLRAAIKKATDAGIIVIAAAGNEGPSEGTTGYPGRYPECICVAASDINQNISSFSSRGPEVDVAAPGDDIWSAIPNNQYAQWDGTSMATPMVAGVAALYVASKKLNGEKPSQEDFRNIIKTKSFTRNPNPPSTASGWGLIQAPAFVKAGGVVQPPPPPPVGRVMTFGKPDFTPEAWGRIILASPKFKSLTLTFDP